MKLQSLTSVLKLELSIAAYRRTLLSFGAGGAWSQGTADWCQGGQQIHL